FLWILKLSTTLFGYGEMALRLFPLLCAIGSLFLFYQVLKKYTVHTSIWYALVLMASGYMYLRYSTEVKQYSCDVAVVLALILLALRKDVLTARPAVFLLYWFIIGSLTIWLSMPGVFMLAAIGFYYLYIVLKAKA